MQASKALTITIVVPALPGSFSKSAPTNGARNRSRTSLTLSWATSTGATRYEYCVDTTNDNVCSGAWVNTGTARSVVIGGLSSKTKYYWQVRSINGNGLTNANSGTWWNFTTS